MTVKITTLDNGLRIVAEQRLNLETASIGVWVNVGARNEDKTVNGITHCLEHMFFKGTENRSARDIAFEIEAVGGHLNAYTTRDNTTYYARVLKDDVPLAVDLLSDILLNSTFDEQELEREKDVILQELGQAIDTPDDIVFDHLQAAAFSEQALGRSILGTTDTIRSFRSDILRQYMRENYITSNMVVSVVGNFDHDALIELVARKFENAPTGVSKQAVSAKYTGGRITEARTLEQIHLTLGWKGCAFEHDDYYPMQIYSTVLGGGMSSRLFQEIREKRGLAYSVYSFTGSHKETGIFGIYAGTSPELASQVIPVIKNEMAMIADNFSEDEIKIAAAQLKAGLMMALESTTSRMEQLGRQVLLFDRIISTEEMISNVEAVSLKSVKAIATSLANSDNISLAAVGDEQVQSLKAA
ncbi:pitrilysin family protein [Kordiimonas sp. SCSIO 12610]|uniref:M16 family metallopeptidase n=1 Tax=Kordiimonas sp. SCSIO 12610 TaxID=2829597 RepID=UPI00210DD33B|nr:pitrilysin family protein [Kordiimonas sp. SCSIO 12610]UTW54905.1 insulinase family protein [Kordiimonas sp. SCSIO 12610]